MDFHGSDQSYQAADDAAGSVSSPGAEGRLQIRAYDHWVGLHDAANPFPPVDELDLERVDFGPRSFLLDLTCGIEDPAITFIGRELAQECGLSHHRLGHVSSVVRGSLLSRLTDHYLQILANRSPVGFEAEFVNDAGIATRYRGILMPFTSSGDTIDFICGAISWKSVSEAGQGRAGVKAEASPAPTPTQLPEQGVEEMHLADWLVVARQGADAAKDNDSRSRSALYEALGKAYDFAVYAEANADDYREILVDAGLKVQARAPMTAVVKLIFGIDYDKSRLTEFAASLAYGRRRGTEAGGFATFIETFEGGLKAMVKAERLERRPAPQPAQEDRLPRLRVGEAMAYVDLPADGAEFVLLIGRRDASGRVAVLAPVKASTATLNRAIRDADLPAESRSARLSAQAA